MSTSLEEDMGRMVEEAIKKGGTITIPGYSMHHVISLTDEEIRKIAEEFGVLAVDRLYADIYMNASIHSESWEERIRSAVWECLVKRLGKLGLSLEKTTEKYIIFKPNKKHPIHGRRVKIKTIW
jgi:hypothetical protein